MEGSRDFRCLLEILLFCILPASCWKLFQLHIIVVQYFMLIWYHCYFLVYFWVKEVMRFMFHYLTFEVGFCLSVKTFDYLETVKPDMEKSWLLFFTYLADIIQLVLTYYFGVFFAVTVEGWNIISLCGTQVNLHFCYFFHHLWIKPVIQKGFVWSVRGSSFAI